MGCTLTLSTILFMAGVANCKLHAQCAQFKVLMLNFFITKLAVYNIQEGVHKGTFCLSFTIHPSFFHVSLSFPLSLPPSITASVFPFLPSFLPPFLPPSRWYRPFHLIVGITKIDTPVLKTAALKVIPSTATG